MVVPEGRHTDAEEKPGQRQGKCPEREVASWLEENCVGVKPPCDQARIGSGVDPECGQVNSGLVPLCKMGLTERASQGH